MCRMFVIEGMSAFDALETKLSLSSLVAHTVVAPPGDEPLPDPEDDPGDLPTDDPPIVQPPIRPSGPVGPG